MFSVCIEIVENTFGFFFVVALFFKKKIPHVLLCVLTFTH